MKTCRRGHELNPENSVVHGQWIDCRTCRREREKERRTRERSMFRPVPELTEAQVRRLRDAYLDGVILDDLAARFGITRDAIAEKTADLPRRAA